MKTNIDYSDFFGNSIFEGECSELLSECADITYAFLAADLSVADEVVDLVSDLLNFGSDAEDAVRLLTAVALALEVNGRDSQDSVSQLNDIARGLAGYTSRSIETAESVLNLFRKLTGST